MNNSWPLVPLGDVLTHRKEFVQISDFENYKRCRVQLHAQGIVLRDVVSGAEIKTKKQQICRAGEFLVAEIDAKVGGFGVVPDDLDGSIVSSHYFLFEVNEEKLDGRFLDYFIRTPGFRDQVAARGSTNYAAIRPHHVLQYRIPLPSLPEQQRIVARIEELAAKINAARALRERSTRDIQALLASRLNSIFADFSHSIARPLGAVAEIVGGGTLPDTTVAEVGPEDILLVKVSDMNRAGNEVYLRKAGNALQVNSSLLKGFRVVPPNSIVFPKRGGAIATNKKRMLVRPAILDPNLMGVFVKDELQVSPHFLFKWFSQLDLASMQDGTSVPQINRIDLVPLCIPVPPIPEQRRIVAELDALQVRVDALRKLQAGTAAELDALLPSVLDKAFRGNL